MTGTYLAEVYDALAGLLDDLNDVLVDSYLPPLTAIGELQAGSTKPALRRKPHLLVRLDGDRESEIPCQQASTHLETVRIRLELRLDSSQREALLYEGVLKTYFEEVVSSIQAGLTDVTLLNWHVTSSDLAVDEQYENSKAWLLTITVTALMQWS